MSSFFRFLLLFLVCFCFCDDVFAVDVTGGDVVNASSGVVSYVEKAHQSPVNVKVGEKQ